MSRPALALIPYRDGDIDRFIPRGDFAAEKASVNWAWKDGPPPGRTWTLMDARLLHHSVLGVGGVFDAGDGHWHAWALLANLTPREWCVAGQLAEEALRGVETFNRPRQITATARTSIPGATAILEKLSFRPRGEVTDERVGPQVIYQLMSRTA